MIRVVSLIIAILSYFNFQFASRVSRQKRRYWWMKRILKCYRRACRNDVTIFALCLAFPRCVYRRQRDATNATVKLFQFHASRFGIDNFLDNGSKVSRSRDCSQDVPRLYEESCGAVKRNGSPRSFVYGNSVLGFSTALGSSATSWIEHKRDAKSFGGIKTICGLRKKIVL